MEVLVVALCLSAILGGVLGGMFLRLVWTTLVMHRQAMHALHQELSQRRMNREEAAHVGLKPGRTFDR